MAPRGSTRRGSAGRDEVIWVEGEKPTKSSMNRHPWWYDQVKKARHRTDGAVAVFNFKIV